MILVHPPVAKPSEPPAGIARLSGALTAHDIAHTVIDANLEALLHIINDTRLDLAIKYDNWTTHSLRNISDNYKSIRDFKTYSNLDRYKRAVIDLNHAVEVWTINGACPGIVNYRHNELSPLRSEDLLRVAEYPEGAA